ncbi:polysaccharide pyruvyl transferase family protein [Membranihabitans marinus]|uniref:polysaccharide pyruvyl transferase family protein n=1 Tax=Membranihabitans marinus TaxID=1227546 RepID=UPI001F35C6B6|nr:polysaccharide pyruvyl transferase family protein [Membranihabitans marinus]
MGKTKINIIGPYDRFNYGDLLFPKMIKYALESQYPDKFQFNYFSIVDADYTEVGGVKTQNYHAFVNELNKSGHHNVIVAGGESIGANWDKLLGFINPLYFALLNKVTVRVFSSLGLAKKILGGKSNFPFCINKSDFEGDITVAYNSVGGTSIPEKCYPRLSDSDYIAVRENITLSLLEEEGINHSHLYPDSAIILSDVFSIDHLKSHIKVRTSIKKLTDQPYIFVQIGKHKHNNNVPQIVEQLNQLGKETNSTIVLCPIGTAPGHEDDKVLKIIAGQLSCSYEFIDNPNVYEIILLIAQSRLYIGTSLHGIISAMSYGVPYIGLNPKQKKVLGYLKTWGKTPINEPSRCNNFLDKAKIALNTDRQKIIEDTEHQKELYYQSIKNIKNCLN